MSKDVNMTSGNLWKKIIVFAIPVMLASVIQLLFNACDLVVVNKFAEEKDAVAAVGSTSSLINLTTNVFIGISVGANIVIARSIGKGDKDECHRYVHTAILFSIIAGIVLTIFGITTARIWLKLMDTTVLDLATLYLRIYFCGSIFALVYNFGAAVLRSAGETKKPLYYIIIAGGLNAILNFIFVRFCHLDVEGVALATVISQGVSAALVIICLVRREGYVHLTLSKLRIYPKSLYKMVLAGLPAAIQSSLISCSNVFIQKAVNSFHSKAIVTGNTASSNVEGFVWASMNSMYQACITFTSQNYGAKKLNNCKKVLFYCMISVIAIGVVLGTTAWLLRRQLLSLYTDTDQELKYACIRITIICLTYALCGLMDVAVGGLRGLGYSTIPMVVSILGMVVFRIIWINTYFKYHHTLRVLYVSYPISWIITALIHYTMYIIVFRKQKEKLSLLEA